MNRPRRPSVLVADKCLLELAVAERLIRKFEVRKLPRHADGLIEYVAKRGRGSLIFITARNDESEHVGRHHDAMLAAEHIVRRARSRVVTVIDPPSKKLTVFFRGGGRREITIHDMMIPIETLDIERVIIHRRSPREVHLLLERIHGAEKAYVKNWPAIINAVVNVV